MSKQNGGAGTRRLAGRPRAVTLGLMQKIAWGCFVLAAAYLGLTSLFTTATIVQVETTALAADNPLWHLAFLVAVVGVIAPLRHRLAAASPRRLLLALVLFTLVAGNALIMVTRIQPRADQGELIELAYRHVVQGNWEGSWYIYRFPHQVGLLLYFMLCTAITHSGAALLVQTLNVAALCAIYCCLYTIARRLGAGRLALNLLLALCFAFFPMLFYVVWVYGNLVGLAFMLLAVALYLRYAAGGRLRWGLLAVAAGLAGVALRQAYLIMVIALALALVGLFLRERRRSALVVAGLCLALGGFSEYLLDQLYGAMTGGPAPLGLPPASHIAMGLSEGELGPGWWHSGIQASHFQVFQNTPQSRELVNQVAAGQITQALDRFAGDPLGAIDFFHRKNASMWCNPTFQCFWIGTRRASEIPNSPLASFFYDEARLGNAVLRGFLNLLQSLILVCATVGLVARRKQLGLDHLLLGIGFVGFFLLHLVWEAKAQYALCYFFLLLPYAALGLQVLAAAAAALPRRLKGLRAGRAAAPGGGTKQRGQAGEGTV